MSYRYASARTVDKCVFSVETLKPRSFYRYTAVSPRKIVGLVARHSGRWLYAVEDGGKFVSASAGYARRCDAEKSLVQDVLSVMWGK